MSTKSKAEKQQSAKIPPAKETANVPAHLTKVANIFESKDDDTPAKPAEVVETKAPGKIAQILAHHKAGLTNKEIVALGFHKTTVNIQVTKYLKDNGLLDATKQAKADAKAKVLAETATEKAKKEAEKKAAKEAADLKKAQDKAKLKAEKEEKATALADAAKAATKQPEA